MIRSAQKLILFYSHKLHDFLRIHSLYLDKIMISAFFLHVSCWVGNPKPFGF